jgi:ribonuclease HII
VSQLVLGIDEAGRGPILGPLVMACVAVNPQKAARLTRLGVTDSKRFTGPTAHRQRSEIALQIVTIVDHFEIQVIDVIEVDQRCRQNGLNRLEQERAHRMILNAPTCKRIICDGQRLFSPLKSLFPHLDAFNEAESRHAAVAAASILAKTRRDEIWHRIAARYAIEFDAELVHNGGGYTNKHTHEFLRAYIGRHGAPPPEARRSWPWSFAVDLLPADFDPFHDFASVPPAQLELN